MRLKEAVFGVVAGPFVILIVVFLWKLFLFAPYALIHPITKTAYRSARTSQYQIALRQISPSTQPNFPYELQLIIQTKKNIQPTTLEIVCDAVPEKFTWTFSTGMGCQFCTSEVSGKYSERSGNNIIFSFQQPTFRPEIPIIVEIWSFVPLSVLEVRRAGTP